MQGTQGILTFYDIYDDYAICYTTIIQLIKTVMLISANDSRNWYVTEPNNTV